MKQRNKKKSAAVRGKGSSRSSEKSPVDEKKDAGIDSPGPEACDQADQEKEEEESLQIRLLRLQADFDNFRKRTLREKGEIYRVANESIMLELLPALDHLDLALDSCVEDTDDAFVKGVWLVREQLLTALGKFDLGVIDVPQDEFDPARHEAISHLPSDDLGENRVISQVRRGYLLGDKLLRASQVVVSSGSQRPTAGEPGTGSADASEEEGE